MAVVVVAAVAAVAAVAEVVVGGDVAEPMVLELAQPVEDHSLMITIIPQHSPQLSLPQIGSTTAHRT